MAGTGVITRPDLTLPAPEAEALRAAYAAASVVLEYGSGGSTILAAEMPGKHVISVESDKAWARMMRRWFEENPPAAGTQVEIVWCDIGPTREWGYPSDPAQHLKFARYPLSVWDRDGFRQPDVVLVDGRFRTGCALAAALRSERPVRVLIDDYLRRQHYHRIERYLGKPEMTGRLAAFDVTPIPLQPEWLADVIEMMTRP
ncbi:MAG: hypothetical protein AAGA28_06700 [Pseudomonadota bacterium]